MKPTAVRLLLAGALFAAWIGYLGYQVLTRPVSAGQPLVVSRPQVLVSDLDVVAEVSSTEGAVEVTVKEVLYQREGKVKVGDTIKVTNLDECRAPHQETREKDRPQPPLDWTGNGPYLLPLRHRFAANEYEVVPLPESPGRRWDWTRPPRIYRDNPETRAQYHQIGKPE